VIATDATDERVMSRVHQMGVYPHVNRVYGFTPFPRFRLFLGQSEKTGALDFITKYNMIRSLLQKFCSRENVRLLQLLHFRFPLRIDVSQKKQNVSRYIIWR